MAPNGDVICLMAAGKTGFASGMKHIGLAKSSDGGTTWTTPIDIYDNATYLTNPHATGTETPFTSTFVSSGHGVTQSIANPGRIAFPALGKTASGTNEYVIYSDDNGVTWSFTDNSGYTGADESKLEELNDGTLRGYNRTTDATDVESWGTQATWSDLRGNGCNSDLIYYTRERDGQKDVMLHSLVMGYSNGHRQDLRLYMSFDQGQTWTEAFQLQPGWAAYSSMQVLDNGDLAILFEDGSIGNEDENDCYDINYVTISKQLMEQKIEELFNETYNAYVKVAIEGSTEGCNTWGTFSTANAWCPTWTSGASSGLAGLTITSTGNDLNHSSVYSQRVLAMRPSADGATDDITITAPEGYYIDSYTITGRNYSANQTYQLYVDETAKITTSTSGATFAVDNVNAKSATFKFYGSSASTNYLCVTNFTVKLYKVDTYTRTVTADSWGTICVPGAVTADAIEGAEIYRIAGKTVNANGQATSLKLEEVTEMEAGVPYLFLATGSELSLTYPESTSKLSAGQDNGLVGSFARMEVETGKYVISANTVVLCGTGCYIGANRAYIDLDLVQLYDAQSPRAVKSITIFDDAATGLDAIYIADSPEATASVYNMAGQRVGVARDAIGASRTLPRGIYIVGGRKHVVR